MILKVFKYRAEDKNSYGIFCEGLDESCSYDFRKLYLKYKSDTEPVYLAHLRTADILEIINNDDKFVEFCINNVENHGSDSDLKTAENFRFLVPAEPSKVIAIARNYALHAQESGSPVSMEPIFFSKLTSSLIAHGDEILIPEKAGRVDHEVELAVYIGKEACNVTRDMAMNHVAGYTVFNDVTARELQKRDKKGGHPYTRAKGFDTFGPCGPYAVPARYIEDPQYLDLELRVNGETKQKSNTENMMFPVDMLISYISSICTLKTGDLIPTGTPEGVSPLKSGDTVTAEIPGIGVLENPVK